MESQRRRAKIHLRSRPGWVSCSHGLDGALTLESAKSGFRMSTLEFQASQPEIDGYW